MACEKNNSFQQTCCHQIWTAGRLKDKFSVQTNLKNKRCHDLKIRSLGKMLGLWSPNVDFRIRNRYQLKSNHFEGY